MKSPRSNFRHVNTKARIAMLCRTKGSPFRPHSLYNDEHPATSVGDRNKPPFRTAILRLPSCSSGLMKRSKLRGGDYGYEKGSYWSPGRDLRSHVSNL
ncbi:hypothetical protein AVEN_54369-1 [Araneus ventricosus]|uniref:Uncharacterized protein n=1 Tax=Araneus ventricosus TaxID=182803 RepID=A0A4Y2PDC5_ARAVE|nr:hypothetical protein AVEN_54369-1 [Araneus ventricosus]